jgi:hypothetical protein
MKDDEPDHHAPDLWAAYLDFYRRQVVDGVLGLPEDERRRTRLPSGWSPVELLSHCLHMEQRWFVWSFLGENVGDPWGDWDIDDPWRRDGGRWQVADDVAAESLAERLLQVVAPRTAEVLAAHRPEELARAAHRFDGDPPTLGWICFHVLQEYARHAGHLDIAVELASDA